jgi:ABC-2 type transport system ATP-binding protein
VTDKPGRIIASGLSKRFGNIRAVEDLSFTVNPGVVTGFLGPNGAGKTTTLRMLLGLVRPDAGSAKIGGHPYGAIVHPMCSVGAVLEASSFHPSRSARNHLRVLCLASGIPLDRVDQVLELVALRPIADRAVGTFSLGMRQRLALAGALLGEPRVLILDEPANGLDPEGIAWLRGFLRDYATKGNTVFMSSHVLAEVAQSVDEVLVISHGRLMRQAALSDLTDSHIVRVRTPQGDDLERLLSEKGINVDRRGADLLLVDGMDGPAIGHTAFEAGIEIHELVAERSQLEQVFLQLTEGRGTAI